jgi:hypothetical protein
MVLSRLSINLLTFIIPLRGDMLKAFGKYTLFKPSVICPILCSVYPILC